MRVEEFSLAAAAVDDVEEITVCCCPSPRGGNGRITSVQVRLAFTSRLSVSLLRTGVYSFKLASG